MTTLTLSSRLKPLMRRGADFLGAKTAIMGGAMSWISERNLVAAISNGGGFGILACGSMTPYLLRAEVQGTKALTRLSFGVNLITMHPELEALIDVCLEEKVSHIVLAGGVPSAAAIKRVKDGGAKVMAFAPTLALGKRLVKMGADAIVIEGMEAGGHIGPVCTSVLVQEILPHLHEQVPVFVAGGIGRGETMLSLLEMGAAGVQVGTLFVCATECIAHQNFKKAFIRAAARDAVPTPQVDPRFSVIPVRAIENEGTKIFIQKQKDVIASFDAGCLTKEQAQLEIERFWAGALRRAAIDGDTEKGSVMAGQVVGLVKEEKPTAEILAVLVREAEQALLHREL